MITVASRAVAQGSVTLSGTIKDAQTGEDLGGATVRLREQPTVGAAANAYGFYTLTAPAGTYTVEISFLGYQPLTRTVTLTTSQKLDFRLQASGQELNEVVVTGSQREATVGRAQMGVETLDLKQVAKVPVLFGEKDVLKTLQLLPGIKSGGEGNGGFFVRGGTADQNLILLDEAPVYNASHLLGFFSTFNSDALKDVTVYKGNMPAQYGGRLSSVVDVKMKDGNSQRPTVSGGLGVIASRLAVEGPLGSDRGSFIVTGRRTYADVFLKLTPDSAGLRDTRLYFYDLNAKANYRLSAKDRLYLSGYLGRDVFGLSRSFNTSYGNQTATLRWNHLFSDRLFANTSLIYSNYDYRINVGAGDVDIEIQSKIKDYNLKQDYELYLGAAHSLRFGWNAIRHEIKPGQIAGSTDSGVNPTEDLTKNSLETAAYLGHEWRATPRLTVSPGLRLSGLSLLGAGTYRRYDASGAEVGQQTYRRGQIGKTYLNLEPRLATSYELTTSSSLKASYARNAQNIHLLSNSATTSPTDIYLATTLNVKPETADQVSLGYYRGFSGPGGQYAFSAETYYKWLHNQIDYRDGTELQGNQDVEADLLYGRGWAYGVELLLKKETGRLTGWLGYTYSRSRRQFDGINGGRAFNARQDKPHDLSVVTVYQLTPRWSLSGTYVASTGNAVTYPVGKYEVNGQVVSYYGPRNADRLPTYSRLDLGATLERPARGRYHSSWNFSLYNALGRQNTYSIRFETDENDPSRSKAIQTALFRWVPSATYNFSF